MIADAFRCRDIAELPSALIAAMPLDDSSRAEAQARVRAAYAPELFAAAGKELLERLSGHFQQLSSDDASKAICWHPPAENVAAAKKLMEPADGASRDEASQKELVERFSRIVAEVLSHGQNIHHPRFIGHQLAPPLPLAGLLDGLSSATNQGMATYEMGPWATAAERAIIDELGAQIGWVPGEFAGVITSGGSLANLTALTAARNVVLGDSWLKGLAGGPAAPAIVAHAEAHYCIVRAAGILGLGTENVVCAGLDGRCRMDPQGLDDTLGDLRAAGRPIVAVCAAACSTRTGAFDPLDEIADVCRRHDVWLHVDAAHGAAASLSPRHRHLVKGLERADSFIWDAHKMLFMPALSALLFYRRAEHQFEAFQQEAPYLFDESNADAAEFDTALKTVECTKRGASFALWGCWALFGKRLFADMVDLTFDLGRRFHALLQKTPDFEPLHEPQCNILVFRHLPEALRGADEQRIGDFQLELRKRIVRSGGFYLSPSKFNGAGALRATLINPLTTEDDLAALIEALRDAGRQLLGGGDD